MDKEVLSFSQDGNIRELSVLSDTSNGQSTKIKQKIRMLDHPKNLIEVLRARLAIEKGLISNAITTGPNKFRFARTFLEGGALRIFDLKATELGQETAANLKIVMNHDVTYFGPNECLSNQKRYLRYNMVKPRRLTTRQYIVLVRDLNSRMAQMPPLLEDAQMLDEFLTAIILSLGALFPPRLAVLVGGSELLPGDVVGGFCALAVLDKGLESCGLRIKTLSNQNYLVRSRRLVGERVDQFRHLKNLRVLEERWQLSHP